jgi:hypothetical protein
MPERADFLPMVSDSGQLQEEQDSEQPRLVLRCKQGRMDAYLVVGTALAVDSGLVDDEAVPVKLDSAPPC